MLENLSKREREIFDLIIEDVSSKEIAHKLNISKKTVDFHRTNLYSKMGVINVKELIAKYSTNGKEAAPEPEAKPVAETSAEISEITTVSKTKKTYMFRFLLPIGILIIAFSVLFSWIFIKKSSAYHTPKGVIIPIQNIGFRSSSDEKDGGSSTSEVFITREVIDGVSIDVLNLKTNLVKKENSKSLFASAFTERPDLIQRLRKAKGIRFKARGDGKSWFVGFQTMETTAETNFAQYRYDFGTVRDKVIIVDIPYSNLVFPEWLNQYFFNFNKETIKFLSVETSSSVQEYGSSLLQIFGFEIY